MWPGMGIGSGSVACTGLIQLGLSAGMHTGDYTKQCVWVQQDQSNSPDAFLLREITAPSRQA